MTNSNGHHPPKPLHGLPTRPATIIGIRDREQMPKFPPEVATEVMRFLESGATGNLQIDVKSGQIMGCRVTSYVRVGPSLDDNGL